MVLLPEVVCGEEDLQRSVDFQPTVNQCVSTGTIKVRFNSFNVHVVILYLYCDMVFILPLQGMVVNRYDPVPPPQYLSPKQLI